MRGVFNRLQFSFLTTQVLQRFSYNSEKIFGAPDDSSGPGKDAMKSQMHLMQQNTGRKEMVQ